MDAEVIASIYLNRGLRGLEEWLGVKIRLIDIDFPGGLVKVGDQREIWINRNLPEWLRLKVLFHEVYHLGTVNGVREIEGLYRFVEQKANKFAQEALKICFSKSCL